MAVTQGNCYMCGKTIGKTAIKNHILKDHNGGDELCYLIRAEGAYAKGYWLYFSVPMDASLLAVDKFLRQIWCECCGHLSAFRSGGAEFGKTRKISSLGVGDTLTYEYDFGSTTEIALNVMGEISRPKQREKVRLLGRNVPPKILCSCCEEPATQIDGWDGEYYCDDCANEGEEEAMLPVTNSPRCGVCGYTGDMDKFAFKPRKIVG